MEIAEVVNSEVLFSPKAVASAIGVSESSLKRWCDSGKINAIRTAGGHRRMNHADIVDFLRQQNVSLQRPDLIGLPQSVPETVADAANVKAKLVQYLIADQKKPVRDLLLSLYVNSWSMELIFDEVVAPAFKEIGVGWEHGSVDVYQERRACENCLAALHEIRSILPHPSDAAPKAIGGSVSDDHYSLPTYAVELTLAAAGWNARSMGSNIPFSSFHVAVEREKPALVWMSVSHTENVDEICKNLNRFAEELDPAVSLVIGGHAVDADLRTGLRSIVCCENLSQLRACTRQVANRDQH